MDERTQNTVDAIRACGADWGILTSVDAVMYATGHIAPIEAGPSPFQGGPTTAIVSYDGEISLLCNELERGGAERSRATRLVVYESLGYQDQRPLEEKYANALVQLRKDLGMRGTAAIQRPTFPWAAAEALEGGVTEFVPVDGELNRRRAIKTRDEIEAMRRCAATTDVGHSAAHEVVEAGRTELEAFADIRCAMESAIGERLPITGDLLSGAERTAKVMGWPIDRTIEGGDPVIVDLAPRVSGYWGDSCNTLFVGEPNEDLSRMYRTTQEALQIGRETLCAGVKAGEFASKVLSVIERVGMRNPLHIGHGIGTGQHEWPRLVPGSDAILEPNMVCMVEPGAYEEGIGGVRLEWMFLITEHGNEVMSGFHHDYTLKGGA
jgi:Xaa-Pro aminopeptidase